MTARETKTVEELLRWAFGREKVHLARKPGLTPSRLSATRDSLSRLGVGVSTSINLGFEAPADAYRIAEAVYALPEYYEFELPERMLPDLGVSRFLRADRSALRRARVNLFRLVFGHALAGTRPDFLEVPRPMQAANDGLVYVPGTNGRKPWYCLVRFDGDSEEAVIRQRTAYLVWRIGLEAVRDDLKENSKLRAFVVSDDLPPIPSQRGT